MSALSPFLRAAERRILAEREERMAVAKPPAERVAMSHVERVRRARANYQLRLSEEIHAVRREHPELNAGSVRRLAAHRLRIERDEDMRAAQEERDRSDAMVARLRGEGLTWPAIAERMGVEPAEVDAARLRNSRRKT